MYLVSIRCVGLEAGIRTRTTPRADLQLIATASMTAMINRTNCGSTNAVVNLYTNLQRAAAPLIAAGAWAGFKDFNYAGPSFQIPLDPATNNSSFLTNSTYHRVKDKYIPSPACLRRRSPTPPAVVMCQMGAEAQFQGPFHCGGYDCASDS